MVFLTHLCIYFYQQRSQESDQLRVRVKSNWYTLIYNAVHVKRGRASSSETSIDKYRHFFQMDQNLLLRHL